MKLVHSESLGLTLDSINASFELGSKSTPKQREAAKHWLISRVGKPGSFRPGFAGPTEIDRNQGVQLFTGERIFSYASVGHILGEESARALQLLAPEDSQVKEILEITKANVHELMLREPGRYCCGRCTVALWRFLTVSDFKEREWQIDSGILHLKTMHSDDGRWHRYPFYYTLLALSDIHTDDALDEKRYAAPAIERMLRRPRAPEPFGQRREVVMRKILSQI